MDWCVTGCADRLEESMDHRRDDRCRKRGRGALWYEDEDGTQLTQHDPIENDATGTIFGDCMKETGLKQLEIGEGDDVDISEHCLVFSLEESRMMNYSLRVACLLRTSSMCSPTDSITDL